MMHLNIPVIAIALSLISSNALAGSLDEAIAGSLAALMIFLVVVIIIFLIMRELVCWYWKINYRIEQNNEIIRLLKKAVGERKIAAASPTPTSPALPSHVYPKPEMKSSQVESSDKSNQSKEKNKNKPKQSYDLPGKGLSEADREALLSKYENLSKSEVQELIKEKDSFKPEAYEILVSVAKRWGIQV